VLSRTHLIVAFGLCHVAFSPASACTVGFEQATTMRAGFCGVDAAPGCTAGLMTSQVADQFKEIALARRCGYQAEADQLLQYYHQTTPLVIKLYECVDKPMDNKAVEQSAQEQVNKALGSMPEGCPDELKSKLAGRLPKLIAVDKQSLDQVQKISTQLGLDK
jgi:hypothetical protein